MPFFGCHLSVAAGFGNMGADALSVGATTFQFFTRNPRGGAVKTAKSDDIAALLSILDENGFGPLIAHGPYTLNPCSANPGVREFALTAMADDLRRLDENLPGRCLYNFHPGSHVGQGVETGIRLIAETLNEILPGVKNTTVLLETMSGKGSEVGSRFEELAEIISRAACPEKIGVCLDTCHVYSAGYDIVSDLDGVLREFDRIVGLERLRALHVNDSMTPFASRKDRHEKLGLGTLGEAAFARIAAHPAFKDLPLCLETPQEGLPGWAAEIARLKAYAAGSAELFTPTAPVAEERTRGKSPAGKAPRRKKKSAPGAAAER